MVANAGVRTTEGADMRVGAEYVVVGAEYKSGAGMEVAYDVTAAGAAKEGAL